MFEQTFVNAQSETRKPWTMGASLTLQVGFVGVVLLLPLLHPGVIQPDFNLQPTLYLTRLAQPPAPAQTQRTVTVRSRGVFHGLMAPTHVPPNIDYAPDPPAEPFAIGAADLPGTGLLLPETVVLPPTVTPPPLVVTKPTPPSAPVHVSSGAQAAKLIFAPKPGYPSLAKSARVQGTVKLQANIARDGVIRDLRVVSGPPLLVAAAMEAVRQWRYQPTLLNGEPIEVATEIDVNFTLN